MTKAKKQWLIIAGVLFALVIIAVILSIYSKSNTQAQDTTLDSEESKQDWQSNYDTGLRFLENGNYEEAILAFTTCITINPKNPSAYIGRGDAYWQFANSADELDMIVCQNAIEDYETALGLLKNDEESFQNVKDKLIDSCCDLAESLLEKNDTTNAEKYLQMAESHAASDNQKARIEQLKNKFEQNMEETKILPETDASLLENVISRYYELLTTPNELQSVLNSYQNNSFSATFDSYALEDLDGDSLPELLLSQEPNIWVINYCENVSMLYALDIYNIPTANGFYCLTHPGTSLEVWNYTWNDSSDGMKTLNYINETVLYGYWDGYERGEPDALRDAQEQYLTEEAFNAKLEEYLAGSELVSFTSLSDLSPFDAYEITETDDNSSENIYPQEDPYAFGEMAVIALCRKDKDVLRDILHPNLFEYFGEEALIEMMLANNESELDPSGEFTTTLSEETIWNGARNMESSNISHVDELETIMDITIEDFRILYYQITSSHPADAGIISRMSVPVFYSDGQWYLTWMS